VTRHGTDDAVADRRREIVEAALTLLDDEGYERLSLRRLAKHLGMHAPGLYWYIESKQQLIDLMAKAAVDDGVRAVRPLADGQTWQEWLVELACTMRRTLLARRDGARVVAGAFVMRNGTITPVIEQALEILENAGFDRFVALGGTMTVLRYTTGIALDEQASPVQEMSGASIAEHLAKFPPPEIDAGQWPRTADALRSAFEKKLGDFPGMEEAREQLFRFGAQMIVRGLAENVSSARPSERADRGR